MLASFWALEVVAARLLALLVVQGLARVQALGPARELGLEGVLPAVLVARNPLPHPPGQSRETGVLFLLAVSLTGHLLAQLLPPQELLVNRSQETAVLFLLVVSPADRLLGQLLPR